MKKLLLAVAAVLVLNVPAFAGTNSTNDFKTIAPSLFKAQKVSPSVNTKDDMTIVYGGEDIARKISNDEFSA